MEQELVVSHYHSDVVFLLLAAMLPQGMTMYRRSWKKGKYQCCKLSEKYQKFVSLVLAGIVICLMMILCNYKALFAILGFGTSQLMKLDRNKISVLVSLLPYKEVLIILKVQILWRNSDQPVIEIPYIPTGEIYWLDQAIPDDIEELLFVQENKEYTDNKFVQR